MSETETETFDFVTAAQMVFDGKRMIPTSDFNLNNNRYVCYKGDFLAWGLKGLPVVLTETLLNCRWKRYSEYRDISYDEAMKLLSEGTEVETTRCGLDYMPVVADTSGVIRYHESRNLVTVHINRKWRVERE